MAKKKQNESAGITPAPSGEVYSVEEEISASAPVVTPDTDDESDESAVYADVSQTVETANARLREMMAQNFIEYASYVIKDRAIPDVDDGLKPVQRRILWSMNREEDGRFQKVANVVGNTMQFHPHGDASIYGALVYLANKELFIEKQGNYGSIITGKAAAAARYIECRLSKLAKDVLFNPDITQVVDSYDGRNVEPVVLPVKIPALLIMGTDGIAVGTNTKIMPHNFNEVLQAQISYLKGEPFTLYPDFPQGGIMDVSKYEDGKGKLTIRAKLEIEGRDIVVKEIPATTTTTKLMDTIEAAVNKNKIKIASFHDYTAKDVDIHLVPIRGYDPAKALEALYVYTDCQISVSCNPMVIQDNHPRCLGISQILARNTDKLVQFLTWELIIEAGRCIEKILVRTLAQIFIGEHIYQKIEKCKNKEAMYLEVRTGLEKFKDEWLPVVQKLHENLQKQPRIAPIDKAEALRLKQLSEGNIPDSEVEALVSIPIRRIAAFEIDVNRKQIEDLQKQLNTAEKNLGRIKQYAIKFLQSLIDRYGAMYPRRTLVCMDGFEKIDMHKIALNNIRVGWDKKNCYIGTNVKSDDIIVCSEVDHLLCIERSGEYKIINIPEKIYIDRLFEFRKYDKNTVFGIVYSEKKSGKVYMKRSVIDRFITDHEYRIIPDGCRIEMITPRPNAIYELKIDTPVRACQTQEINLANAPLRSPRAGGTPISQRKLLKITFLRYIDETDEANSKNMQLLPEEEEPENPATSEQNTVPTAENTPPDQSGIPSQITDTAAPVKTKTPKKSALPRKNSSSQSGKTDDSTPAANPAEANPAAVKQQPSGDEEDWGIQPDLGF